MKDRFQQFTALARGLLSDFREVEQNFREPRPRGARAHRALGRRQGRAAARTSSASATRIADSDQGQELPRVLGLPDVAAAAGGADRLLEHVLALPPVAALEPDPRAAPRALRLARGRRARPAHRGAAVAAAAPLPRRPGVAGEPPHHGASCAASRASARWRCATRRPTGRSWSIDEIAPAIELPMERPLFTPARSSRASHDAVLVEAATDVARRRRPVRAGRTSTRRGSAATSASALQHARAGHARASCCEAQPAAAGPGRAGRLSAAGRGATRPRSSTSDAQRSSTWTRRRRPAARARRAAARDLLPDEHAQIPTSTPPITRERRDPDLLGAWSCRC